ncbi:MAG: glutamyl-tRNA reductase [Vampirovibrio sp.]
MERHPSVELPLYQDYLMLGVHYTTADLDIRESFSFQDYEVTQIIEHLTQAPQQSGIRSLVVLTTCNRVELYALCSNVAHAKLALKQYFIEEKGIDAAIMKSEAVIVLYGQAVPEHLYRVACGLDSLILGEGQILSQVKTALEMAQATHTPDFPLERSLRAIFCEAIHVGKQVRSKTGIASRDASVSKATLDLAMRHHPDLVQRHIVVVGGGKMACLILERLNELLPLEKRHHVQLLNRSAERLKELEARFSFSGVTWEGAKTLLNQAELLFVATGAPHLLFHAEQFQDRITPLSIYDIAVPRNVCPDVAEAYPHINVYDTDALIGMSSFDPQKEARLRQSAEALIEKALNHLPNCLNKIACEAELKHFRDFVETLHEDYVQNHPLALEDLPPEAWQDASTQWSAGLIQRLLHSPSTLINQGRFQVKDLSILRDLFQPLPYSREPFSLKASRNTHEESTEASPTFLETQTPKHED